MFGIWDGNDFYRVKGKVYAYETKDAAFKALRFLQRGGDDGEVVTLPEGIEVSIAVDLDEELQKLG